MRDGHPISGKYAVTSTVSGEGLGILVLPSPAAMMDLRDGFEQCCRLDCAIEFRKVNDVCFCMPSIAGVHRWSTAEGIM